MRHLAGVAVLGTSIYMRLLVHRNDEMGEGEGEKQRPSCCCYV